MNLITLIKTVIHLVLLVQKEEILQIIIVIHVPQDLHLKKEKDQIVIKLIIVMMDIIMMKKIIHIKNA
jgi:hypothetical protein